MPELQAQLPCSILQEITILAEKKIAIVTGGVRRLGGLISLGLLNAGYSVAAIHNGLVPAEFEEKTKGLDFLSIPADLSDVNQTRYSELIEIAKHHFKSDIHVLVNNAAIIEETDFLTCTPADWDRIFSINLKSVFFFSQAVALDMTKNEISGNIVLISDTAGSLTWPHYSIYNLTKTGVSQLTRIMAKTLAPLIRVNAVAPGTIIPFEGADEAWMEAARQRSVLKKIGNPEDVVKLIRVILETEFMTGSVLTVDGGRSLI